MFHIFTDYPYAPNKILHPEEDNEKYTLKFVNETYSKYTNTQFNRGIYELYPNKILSILNYGCGVGDGIEQFIQDGHIALGLDGFYVYKKYLLEQWGRLPNNFLTCDLAKPFTVNYHEYALYNKDIPFEFDIVETSEFMEHLFPDQINQACENISKHLKVDGIVIAEISTRSQGGHHTLESRDWWINKFKEYCMIEDNNLNTHFAGKYYRNLDDSHKFCFRK